jgi:hypothetical protein
MTPANTIRRAILDGQFPEDIAAMIKESFRVFQIEPALYDQPGLQGAAKHAELVVKLGYWLALGRLTGDEFREWTARIPPEDNQGWDVDLFPIQPGSVFPHILKMGRLFPFQEVCCEQRA